ncbi:MAG: hypothetical protein QNJ40_19275 [Xanthomonadales bacterium]|nr:hypothetical protein [Xanthomonadales bacterium]
MNLSLPDDTRLQSLISSNFGAFKAIAESAAPCEIDISIDCDDDGFDVSGRIGSVTESFHVSSEHILYGVESFLVPALQLARPKMMFLHGAVVACGDQAFLIVGESGAGKSTLTWALASGDFDYLSDELAPVSFDEAGSPMVMDYPHAICLKSLPEEPFCVPETTLYTGATWHIPVKPPESRSGFPSRIKKIFFINHRGHSGTEARVTELTASDAAFKLYPNVLNALAHENQGLSMVRRLSESVACYNILSADLEQTSKVVARAIHE